MEWSRSTAQTLKRQLTTETCKILDFLAQNPDRKFKTDELVNALSLKNSASLRSRLGKTTIAAKRIGVPQDELHSWFVLWESKPEWRYWLDSVRANWWLPNSKWTKEELRASVEAYVEMHRLESKGLSFKKREYYTQLSNKFGRTAKAFECRMQNISYLYELQGRQWVLGLQPA